MEQRKNPPVSRQISQFVFFHRYGRWRGQSGRSLLRGCRIESLTDVQPGASLEVRIAAIEHEPPIQIQEAIVRWSRERQFGLEFEMMAPEEWAHLQHIVKQIEMEPYERDQQAAELGESS